MPHCGIEAYAVAMPPERSLIDLDEHERGDAQPSTTTIWGVHPANRQTVLRLVAVFSAGVLLGGVGADGLRDARDRQERDSIVKLVAMPASYDGAGMNSSGVAQLNGKLALINGGPAPITVLSAQAQGSDVLIRDTGQTRLLPPGGTASIDVEALFQCSLSAFGPNPLSMRFSVETAEGRAREVSYPIALTGSAWHDAISLMCSRASEHSRP